MNSPYKSAKDQTISTYDNDDQSIVSISGDELSLTMPKCGFTQYLGSDYVSKLNLQRDRACTQPTPRNCEADSILVLADDNGIDACPN